MKVLDYRGCWALERVAIEGVEVNACRTQILSKCELSNEETGEKEEFFLAKACIGENMYDKSGNALREGITQIPTCEICRILNVGMMAELKKYADHDNDVVFVGKHAEKRKLFDGRDAYWTDFRLDLKEAEGKPLETKEEICQSTSESIPMVARTTYWDDNHAWKAMLEYPVVYLNWHPTTKEFGLDVGPILYADLRSISNPLISCLEMAYVIYQCFDRAEFAVRVPTKIKEDVTLHFSKVLCMDVKNEFFSLAA